MHQSKTGKNNTTGSKSSRVKEYLMKDQSKEDSSVKIPQLLANIKGYTSTIKANATIIKGTTRNNSLDVSIFLLEDMCIS